MVKAGTLYEEIRGHVNSAQAVRDYLQQVWSER
jgi:hypothetical protein